MPLFDAVRLALATLRVQKLKSFFTLAGVCIGVMFLITVVSIIEGMGRYMKDDLVGKLIAVNSFELRRTPNIQLGDIDRAEYESWRRRPRLTIADLRPVVEALPEGTRWAQESTGNVSAVSRYSRPRTTTAIGIDGDWFGIKKLALKDGREFTQQEMVQGENVVILGPDMVERAFPGLDPIGREIRIGSTPYRVIGVTESRGRALGLSFDNFVIAPWRSPIRKLLNPLPHQIDAVVVQAGNQTTLIEAQERVRAIMRTRHGLRPAQRDDFTMQTSESALAFWNRLQGYLVVAGVALPAIGLVVGAIVIMNIMLVAVAERTREIGIRKALGARRRDILAQFLVESTTLSTTGAAIGVALGIGFAQAVAAVTPLPASVAPWSIVVGVLVGVGVGVASGVYPASRASRLDPVAALRSE